MKPTFEDYLKKKFDNMWFALREEVDFTQTLSFLEDSFDEMLDFFLHEATQADRYYVFESDLEDYEREYGRV